MAEISQKSQNVGELERILSFYLENKGFFNKVKLGLFQLVHGIPSEFTKDVAANVTSKKLGNGSEKHALELRKKYGLKYGPYEGLNKVLEELTRQNLEQKNYNKALALEKEFQIDKKVLLPYILQELNKNLEVGKYDTAKTLLDMFGCKDDEGIRKAVSEAIVREASSEKYNKEKCDNISRILKTGVKPLQEIIRHSIETLYETLKNRSDYDNMLKLDEVLPESKRIEIKRLLILENKENEIERIKKEKEEEIASLIQETIKGASTYQPREPGKYLKIEFELGARHTGNWRSIPPDFKTLDRFGVKVNYPYLPKVIIIPEDSKTETKENYDRICGNDIYTIVKGPTFYVPLDNILAASGLDEEKLLRVYNCCMEIIPERIIWRSYSPLCCSELHMWYETTAKIINIE